MNRLILFLLVVVMEFTANAVNTPSQKINTDSLTLQNILNEVRQITKKMSTDTLAGMPMAADSMPKVVSIGIIGKSRTINTADYGDHISVKLTDLDKFLAIQNSFHKKGMNDSLSEIILYINGNPMRDIEVSTISTNEKSLVFHLDRHSQWLVKFNPYFPYLWSKIHVYISVGFRNGVFLGTEDMANKFYLQYINNSAWLLTFLLLATIVTLFLLLAIRTNLIRVGDSNSPYSLALTQLAFWTLIIAASFFYIWVITRELTPLTGSTLVLLSISIGTTAGSKLVDIRRFSNTPGNMPGSDGFFKDVLSDDLGYSVHRSQMFLWTLILGIIFVGAVVVTQKMPQLDASLLGLMGLSSTAYVGLKTIENKQTDTPDQPK